MRHARSEPFVAAPAGPDAMGFTGNSAHAGNTAAIVINLPIVLLAGFRQSGERRPIVSIIE